MPQHFATNLLDSLANKIKSISEKLNQRFSLSSVSSIEASQRFAECDIKNGSFPLANVQGDKDHPYYSFNSLIPDGFELGLEERLNLEEKFHSFFNGGGFVQIPIEEDVSSETLLKKTKQICEKYTVGFFAYSAFLSYCNNCHKTIRGFLQKCPKCSTTQVIIYARQSTKYSPISWWQHQGLLNKAKKTK
jgi:anaerobic ribonucleoside-triphosphate reductase